MKQIYYILLIIFVFSNFMSPYSGQTHSEYIESIRMEQFIYKKCPKARNHKKDIHNLIYNINTLSRKYNMDKYLALAHAMWEGEWLRKPNSKTVGRKGEIGYFQFMIATARKLGYSKKDLRSINKNTECRYKFYRWLLKKYSGDHYMALAYYNGGGNWRKITAAKVYPKRIFKVRKELIDYVKSDS